MRSTFHTFCNNNYNIQAETVKSAHVFTSIKRSPFFKTCQKILHDFNLF